ncbi:VOC family protein [Kribbella sp. NPDC050281]|uniref:VOC family protein n=1 Tax=Kribbella sp. NPDC050281 TaxID=3155515 RepID=UPI0033F65BD6
MAIEQQAHVRIARPSRDLTTVEQFWVDGLGLSVIYRKSEDGHHLLMVGWPEAGWHLELVQIDGDPMQPQPTEEDLLVVYLDGPVPDELVARLIAAGGELVPSRNPYWDTWGVTIADPDSYRLVLCTRGWSNH